MPIEDEEKLSKYKITIDAHELMAMYIAAYEGDKKEFIQFANDKEKYYSWVIEDED